MNAVPKNSLAEVDMPDVPNVLSIPVHEDANRLPMMEGDDFRELVASIAQIGQIDPIVVAHVGGDWVLVDGRNRREACRELGIEPEFVLLDAKHERHVGAYLLAKESRRQTSKGQKAMFAALVNPEPEVGGRGRKSSIIEGFSPAALSYARTVLRETPDLVDSVIAGDLALHDAYATAQSKVKQREEEKQRRDHLRSFPKIFAAVEAGRFSSEDGVGLTTADDDYQDRALAGDLSVSEAIALSSERHRETRERLDRKTSHAEAVVVHLRIGAKLYDTDDWHAIKGRLPDEDVAIMDTYFGGNR